MQFLVNEERRHVEDIIGIERDMAALQYRWNIEIPEPNHTFMKVK